MKTISKNAKRVLTGLTVLVSVLGIIYLILFISVKKDSSNDKNPFEYNIDIYRQTPPGLVLYKETEPIKLDYIKITGLALDYLDNLYLAADKKIVIYNSHRLKLTEIELDDHANCLSVNKFNHIYVGIKGHVEVYTVQGKKLKSWESLGEKAVITSIAVDINNVFIADFGHRLVWHFDISGNLINQIQRKDDDNKKSKFIVPSPYFDLLISKSGDSLWVVNPGMQLVENYTFDGKKISSWGHPSMNIDGFSGCCNPSHITMNNKGEIITSEKGLPRVKIYTGKGSLKGVVAGAEIFEPETIIEDLSVDSKGKVYILDPVKKQVRIFNKK